MKEYIAPIESVSLGLKEMVKKEVLVDSSQTEVKVSLEEPNADWVSSLGGKPVINLYLYRMQEKLQSRFSENHMQLPNENNCKHLIGRRPKFVELFYAVTVWVRSKKDSSLTEQNLISRFLQGLGKFEMMEQRFLTETGFNAEPYGLPILFFAEDPLRSQTEFWSALGTTPKPMVPLSVTVPIKVHEPMETPFVNAINRKFGTMDHDPSEEKENKATEVTQSGKISNLDQLASKRLAVISELVNHPEIHQEAKVEEFGCYRIYNMPVGNHFYWVVDRDDPSKETEKKIIEIKENASGETIPVTQDIEVEF